MLTKLIKKISLFQSKVPYRRQNFFQLNPIFPDNGQKDFDIYNVDYNHVYGSKISNQDMSYKQKLQQKIKDQFYLGPVLSKYKDLQSGNFQVDQQTGFPIGINQDFDDFITTFKLQKKVGSNVIVQFQNLIMNLMKKFQKKSQIQLIKIYRFNLAFGKTTDLNKKIKSAFLTTSLLKYINNKNEFKIEQIQKFIQQNKDNISKQKINQHQNSVLSQKIFINILKQFDTKINKLQEDLHKKALANGSFIPTFHPVYGRKIQENVSTNMDYDLNNQRGFSSKIVTNQKSYTDSTSQDIYIESRINKLFFLQALKKVQGKVEFSQQQLSQISNLPIEIRQKDKFINQMLYKYRQQQLLVEPDIKDIYSQIDIALKKVVVKVVPNTLNNNGQVDSDAVNQRILSKDILLWDKLDIEQIFQFQQYNEQALKQIKIQQTALSDISPSSIVQLSLNKLPMNLYRHRDLQKFNVYNKYRKTVITDYYTDYKIDPQLEFKFFSIQDAKKGLKKIKRQETNQSQHYGHAKRKTSQAQVFLHKGTGIVMINKQPLADYFGDVYHRGQALKPLIFTQTAGQFDLQINVVGGGVHGQSQCIAIALTRALIAFNPKFQIILAGFGLVGTDDRRRQPKRIGLYTARRRPPYVRR